MKKLIFGIMIMLMTAVSVSAAEPELNILNACGAEGGQLEVTVEISESDVIAGSFVVGYDDMHLSPVSVTPGVAIGTRTVLTNLNYDRDGVRGIKVSFLAKIADDEQIPLDNGVLCTIIFDVIEADKTVSDVYIKTAELFDKDEKIVPYTETSGKIYLNQFVCDGIFTKDGNETDKLSDSGMALDLGVFNGTNKDENLRAYIAQYSTYGNLISVKSVEYALSSGDSSSDTFILDISKDTEYLKVMCWDEENAPFSEIFYIER